MQENIKLSFRGIWGHKLRSGLTMLGIIIGIAAIMAIVATIRGTNEQIKQNLIGSGNNSVVVSLYEGDYPMDMSYSAVPDGIPVFSEDVKEEIENLSEVSKASFYQTRSAHDSIYRGNSALSGGTLYGIDSNYFSVYGYRISRGRGLVEDDFTQCRKVVILDDISATNLFQNSDPLNQTIEILGEPFTVIGIATQKSAFKPVINTINDYYTYVDQSGGFVFIPDSTWPVLYQFDEPQSVAVRAAHTDDMTNAGKKTADILNSNFSLGEESTIKYKSENLLQQAKDLQDFSSAAQRQLIWIAGISLLVGGIGVMNIMLVSVTERTREIGLKKALGARRRYILIQFLTEAAVLTSIGGIIGVLAGMALIGIISSVLGTPMSISVSFSILAVVFSMVIGLLFGLFPAMKASKQNPIDALRYQG